MPGRELIVMLTAHVFHEDGRDAAIPDPVVGQAFIDHVMRLVSGNVAGISDGGVVSSFSVEWEGSRQQWRFVDATLDEAGEPEHDDDDSWLAGDDDEDED